MKGIILFILSFVILHLTATAQSDTSSKDVVGYTHYSLIDTLPGVKPVWLSYSIVGPAKEFDKSMLMLSAKEQFLYTKRTNIAYIGSALSILAFYKAGKDDAANAKLAAQDPNFQDPGSSPLNYLGGGLAIVSAGFYLSAQQKIGRSGLYLQAYANGVIITF